MPAEPRAALAALPDLATVEKFLYLEARLLDERRFEAWYELFAEDGVYWAPTRHEQASPVEAVSLFYDDRVTMAARIKRLSHPQAHIQVPVSRTAHLVSNVELDPASTAETVIVHASFFMAEHRQDEPRWYGGRYEYRLRPSEAGLRIARKKVVLVNAGAAFTSMSVYL